MQTTEFDHSTQEPLNKDETATLIAADKVHGTAVFDREGAKLGTVKSTMIDKYDGRVRYVVMASGGLFGMGEERSAVPWDALEYDTDKDGYRLKNLSKEELEKNQPPRFSESEAGGWNEDYERRVHLYFFPPA